MGNNWFNRYAGWFLERRGNFFEIIEFNTDIPAWHVRDLSLDFYVSDFDGVSIVHSCFVTRLRNNLTAYNCNYISSQEYNRLATHLLSQAKSEGMVLPADPILLTAINGRSKGRMISHIKAGPRLYTVAMNFTKDNRIRCGVTCWRRTEPGEFWNETDHMDTAISRWENDPIYLDFPSVYLGDFYRRCFRDCVRKFRSVGAPKNG